MITKIHSVSVEGLEGMHVEVEVDISSGLPNFMIVGLGDAAIQESKERIRSAIKNSGFVFPPKRITVNLAPAHIRKKGASFDFPIAVGILDHILSFKKELLDKSLFVGELALDGQLRPVSSILPSVIFAKAHNLPYIFIPMDNLEETRCIPNLQLIPIAHLREVFDILQGDADITKKIVKTDNSLVFANKKTCPFDFGNILGQEQAKRALLISAAGGHNLIME